MTRIGIVAAALLALWGGAAYAANASVTIQNATFTPASVTINAGESVTWTNLDGIPHSAKADNNAFDTGIFSTGSRTLTIANPGTYGYFCAVHPGTMRGTVSVLGQATPAPTPQPTPAPTPVPTPAPTAAPTAPPTPAPTAAPTRAPTLAPVPILASPAPTATALATPTASPAPSPSPAAAATPTPAATLAQTSPSPAAAAAASPPPVRRDDGLPVGALAAIGASLGVTALVIYLARRGR